MTTITLRANKGGSLSFQELDADWDCDSKPISGTTYNVIGDDNRSILECSGGVEVILPDPSTFIPMLMCDDFRVTVKNIDTDQVIVSSSVSIDYLTTDFHLDQYDSYTFQIDSTATMWNVISNYKKTYSTTKCILNGYVSSILYSQTLYGGFGSFTSATENLVKVPIPVSGTIVKLAANIPTGGNTMDGPGELRLYARYNSTNINYLTYGFFASEDGSKSLDLSQAVTAGNYLSVFLQPYGATSGSVSNLRYTLEIQ